MGKFQLQTNNNGATMITITLSLHAFIAIVIMVCCCSLGLMIGLKRRKNECTSTAADNASSSSSSSLSSSLLLLETAKKGGGSWSTDINDNVHVGDNAKKVEVLDGPTMVLRGSLELMACQWGGGQSKYSNRGNNNNIPSTKKNGKVVEYLSPERMMELLFSKRSIPEQNKMTTKRTKNEEQVDEVSRGRASVAVDAFQSLRLEDDNDDDAIQHCKDGSQQKHQQSEASFLHLLSLIQKYSVNTSHPYFFNQLFGALDPIALAAEIVALSVNTSVYTYETAPVFTLLEQEVMGQIGKLVFEHRCPPRRHRCPSSNENQQRQPPTSSSSVTTLQHMNEKEAEVGGGEDEEEFVGEGLMIPGGSLANLTAMHAARHRWKVMNGYTRRKQQQQQHQEEYDNPFQSLLEDEGEEEEKKVEDSSCHETDVRRYRPSSSVATSSTSSTISHLNDETRPNLTPHPDLVALVSSEAHYSFAKSARILGLREDDLIVIPTHADGRMDVSALAKKLEELELGCDIRQEVSGKNSTSSSSKVHDSETRNRVRVPFFVACTAGSTVRGSFDEIADIVKVCRDYEARGCSGNDISSSSLQQQLHHFRRTIWVHVDGAWGGSAIFSSRPFVRSVTHMDEIRYADSFTFNPHKMLGAPQQTTAFIVRHRNALRDANAAGAKYLFDPRKNGAEYDLGDLSYTCGRRTDAVKLWALWKYYGRAGLGDRVDQKVDELALFVEEIHKRPSFALACKPWPFNVNFFYFPPRIRRVLELRGVIPRQSLSIDRMVELASVSTTMNAEGESREDYIQIPDDIAKDLANVSVMLKLRMHEAGEMIIPYQVRHLS